MGRKFRVFDPDRGDVTLDQDHLNEIMGGEGLATHYSVEHGIKAGGKNREDAAKLTKQYNIVTDYENRRGVVLPEEAGVGQPITVVNDADKSIRVYGPKDGRIDDLDADYGVSLSPGDRVKFMLTKDGQVETEMLNKRVSSYGAKHDDSEDNDEPDGHKHTKRPSGRKGEEPGEQDGAVPGQTGAVDGQQQPSKGGHSRRR